VPNVLFGYGGLMKDPMVGYVKVANVSNFWLFALEMVVVCGFV